MDSKKNHSQSESTKTLRTFIKKEVKKVLEEAYQQQVAQNITHQELRDYEKMVDLIWHTTKVNDVKSVSPPDLKNWAIGFSMNNDVESGRFNASWKTSNGIARLVAEAYVGKGKMSFIDRKLKDHDKASFIILRYKH
jgi:galactitol-specific phosphotransferase system IIB component